jgi:restriction system protein
LIDSPKQGVVVITQRGVDVLKKNPSSIDARFLKQFAEFVDFQSAKREEENIQAGIIDDRSIETPEEALETAYQRIRKSLALDILNKVMTLSPAFFEKLVVELLC